MSLYNNQNYNIIMEFKLPNADRSVRSHQFYEGVIDEGI